MLDAELQFFESITTKLHARLDQADLAVASLHDKFDIFARGTFQALHHILEKELPMSALTDAVRAEIATVSADVDQLIASAKQSDDAAVRDIQSDLDALKSKVAGALSSAAPAGGAAASTAPPATPVTVTVSAPTAANSVTIPVSPADASSASTALGNAITAGSTVAVSGPSIPAGATLQGVDTSGLTISAPTTDAHAGDGTETVTLTPAAAPSA